VGSYFSHGDQVRGESEAEYREVVESAQQSAAEAMEKTRIPGRLREYVRDYIDSLTPERR
jgi:hypothetical protein